MNRISCLVIVLLLFAVESTMAQRKPKTRIDVRTLANVTYSPNQTYLAVGAKSKVAIIGSSTSAITNRLGSMGGDVTSVAFARNGLTLLMSHYKGTIEIWDYVFAKPVTTIKIGDKVQAIQMLNNDVAIIRCPDKVLVYDVTNNKTLRTLTDQAGAVRAIAVSDDEQYFATGGADGHVKVYEAATFKCIHDVKVQKGWVRCVAFSPDSKVIVSGDTRGKVVKLDLETETYFDFGHVGGWVRSIAYSKDGKYVAVGDDLGNCTLYSCDSYSFKERFKSLKEPVIALEFSPDGKYLAGVEQFRSVVQWNVEDLDIKPANKLRDDKDHMPPQILVSNPPNILGDRSVVFKDMIDIKGILIDDAGVASLKVNGMNVPLRENGNFLVYFPLKMGDNPVTVEAKDVNDNISVKRFVIQRKNEGGEEFDAAKARNFLVAIGIDDYEHWPKLNNGVRDATDITSILLERYNFKLDNVTVLKNEQASRANIYKSLRSLIEKITPQDNLIVYFSGHGYFDQILGEGYWVPVEAEAKSTGDYLSNTDLLKLIGNINSQHTFLIADACFSGSLFADSKRGYADNVEKFKSRWGLASGRLEVVSDGEIGQNSPFAGAVITFLRDNDKDKVAISELVQYVKVAVTEKTQQTPIGNPLKIPGDEGGELVLHLDH